MSPAYPFLICLVLWIAYGCGVASASNNDSEGVGVVFGGLLAVATLGSLGYLVVSGL